MVYFDLRNNLQRSDFEKTDCGPTQDQKTGNIYFCRFLGLGLTKLDDFGTYR